MNKEKSKFRSHIFNEVDPKLIPKARMILNDTEESKALFKKLNTHKGSGSDTDVVVNRFGGDPGTVVRHGGGGRMDGAEVNVIFWGDKWNSSNPPNPSAQDILNDIAGILASPYLYTAHQYELHSYAGHLGGVWINDRTIPDHFTIVDVNYEAWLMMTSGPIQVNSETVVCIVMQPGSEPYSGHDGAHGYSIQPDFRQVPTMYLQFQARNKMSKVFSHELVETVTDPFGDGIQIEPTDRYEWNEVGDVCNQPGNLNGITVAAYWSERDNTCVIPQPAPVTSWQIRCIYKRGGTHSNPNQNIKMVGGVKIPSGQSFWMSQKEVIKRIDSGDKFFVNGADGSSAEVKVFIHFPTWQPQGSRYIATVKDSSTDDNLLSLPDCTLAEKVNEGWI